MGSITDAFNKDIWLSFISLVIAVAMAKTLEQLFLSLHLPIAAIAVLDIISNSEMLNVLSRALTGSLVFLVVENFIK